MRIYLILLFGVLIIIGSSCNRKCKDPSNIDCENYDPCYGKQPFKADFVILVGDYGGNWFNCYDTILELSSVLFKATCEGDSFVWNTGGQIIRGNQFSRNRFDTGLLQLTLIVYHHSKYHCFGEKDGVDTVVKNFYVWSNPEYNLTGYSANNYTSLPIWGTYYGYWDSRPKELAKIILRDTFRYDCPWEIGKKYQALNMVGIPDSLSNQDPCNAFDGDFKIINYTSVYINKENPTICSPYYQPAVKASAHLVNLDMKGLDVSVEYKGATTNWLWVKDHFTGHK